MALCSAQMTHLNRFSINFQEIDSAKAKKCPSAFKKSIFSPCSVGSVIGDWILECLEDIFDF